MMVGMPVFYESVLPIKHKDNKKLLKLLTGISIAGIESFVLCPFERAKTHVMTEAAKGKQGYSGLFQQAKSHSFTSELFSGLVPLFAR